MVGGMHGGGCALQGSCVAGEHVWWEVYMVGDVHARGACMGACVAVGCVTRTHSGRYYGIRSVSGRYASY